MPANYQAPLSQFSGTGTPNYISRNGQTNGAYLQSVDPNSLVQNQLASLQRSDNPIVQSAAQTAQANALARGGGVSGTQAIDASNRGMFDILSPVAAADAGRYGAVGDANQSALNQQNLEHMQNQTSITEANIGAAPQVARNHEMSREFDLQQQNRQQDRQWALADQNTQARASARSQVFSQALQTIFSDPAYFGDPQGAMGLLQTYSGNIDSMLQGMFPEYYATDQNGNPTGGGGP